MSGDAAHPLFKCFRLKVQLVEQAGAFRYLGSETDRTLFSEHSDSVVHGAPAAPLSAQEHILCDSQKQSSVLISHRCRGFSSIEKKNTHEK